ncbi:MAG TPA: APC family permease [Caulobacterales bacterium]|nr:APC family permease [Caulobacterales bacterium]
MSQKRVFGFWSLALYATSMNLGIRWFATAAAAGPASLPIWILAAIGFLIPLALATCELAGRFPEEGAIYAWTRETFGPFAGFICGWIYWVCNLPYFSGLLVFTANLVTQIAGPAHPEFSGTTFIIAFSIAGSIVVALLNYLGLNISKWLASIGSIAGFAMIAVLFGVGAVIVSTHGSATDFAHADYAPPFDANGAILWSTMVFAFGGAEGVAMMRNEVRGGMKTIVAALLLVSAVLALLYMLGTTLMLSIIPASEATRLSGIGDAFSIALGKLGLTAIFPWVLLAFAMSQVGGYSSWFAVAARLPYAAGLTHALPAVFAKTDRRTGAPIASIVLQTVFVIVLVALSQAGESTKGAYDFLVAMSVLSYTLPFAFLFAVYLKVQGKPLPEGAWATPGGARWARVIGVVGFVVTASAIVCTLVPSPDATDKTEYVVKLIVASAILLLSGAVVYALAWLGRRLAKAPA